MAQEQLTQIVNLIARAEKAERELDEARRFVNQDANQREYYENLLDVKEDELATLRAIIARAVEAIEPFNAWVGGIDARRAPNEVALIAVYSGDLRSLAALAADLRKAGEGT